MPFGGSGGSFRSGGGGVILDGVAILSYLLTKNLVIAWGVPGVVILWGVIIRFL